MTDEHAMKVAEQAYSAGNLVTCDGYYEFDLDAAAAVIAAAIAALDAARGDPVARVVEFIREQQANAHRHMLEAAHRETASHFAAAFVTLRNLADEIERGEPFNG